MAERRSGGDREVLTDAAAAVRRDDHKHHDAMNSPEDLSLEEILRLYSQPINEEQAWAVCYQCCRTLAKAHREPRRISGPEDVRIQRDGSVRMDHRGGEGFPPVSGKKNTLETFTKHLVIESLGIMIYKALDYGLKENEERELSPPLEQLIDLMTNSAEAEKEACLDEGYEATEEEDEREYDPKTISSVHSYRDILKLCTAHLPSVSDGPSHYQAVCRALYTETRELRTFLQKIKSAKENLRKMEKETSEEPGRDLNELQNADWARFWVQVMRDLREGVKLKKVQERQYNPLPIEYQLTPYEMLMDDIRSKRYKLRKVMVNADIPPRLKKSAHEVILEFIRSRPPLNPVSARKLKPQAQPPPTLHERILEEIKAERKLRPVSPDQIRRGRLGKKSHYEFSPYMGRRTSSSLSLSNGSRSPRAEPCGSQSVPQRKKLLKAPSLAELDSSDSDVSQAPPMFLPISSTPQPERRQTPQRRHSIEKETPTSVRQFQPPSKQNSRSLVRETPTLLHSLPNWQMMIYTFFVLPYGCEDSFKSIQTELKRKKCFNGLCFCCRTKRFSFFTWSYTCQFCKKPVCSQCCKKMRLPSKPYSSLPIYSIGSTNTLPRDRISMVTSFVSVHHRLSKHGSLKSHEELELPPELTEDWATMEVCVDCKKFISDIIASSKHSLSLATKRARLKRKTQSFYMSSPKGAEGYRPSERTINEI
uniref:Spire-type actin nucleation factor 1b n=1 Tax=Fundulus heteroclitus TaxID=8078 RepID=A0A3Q2P9E3_FUNHE